MTVTRFSLFRTSACLALLFAACDGADEPAGRAFAPMDLVRVGTIGWHPDDIPGPVAILDLHRDGRMVLDGTEVASYDELSRALLPLAEASREEGGMAASRLALVLRCDRDVPWRAVQWALQSACAPEVRLHQVLFGVLPLEGDREGTLGISLPMDRGLAEEENQGEVTVVRVTLRAGEPAGAPAALAPRLRYGSFPAWVTLDVGADVPVGFVLRVADAAFRAGVSRILLVGAPGPRIVDPVTASTPGPVSIRVDGEELPEGLGEELPPVPRVDGLAGSVGVFLMVIEDPIIEEVKREGPEEEEDMPVEESLGEGK